MNKEAAIPKRALRWFTLVSFLLGTIGIVVAIMVNAAHIDVVLGPIYLVSFIGSISGLLAVLLFLTAWILAIIRLGQLRQWTWFTLLLATLVVFFPLGAVCFLLYLAIGPDDRPAQPAQSPAYLPYSVPPAPATPPYVASQPALPAQSYEQSLHYPSYAPAHPPHNASERPLQ